MLLVSWFWLIAVVKELFWFIISVFASFFSCQSFSFVLLFLLYFFFCSCPYFVFFSFQLLFIVFSFFSKFYILPFTSTVLFFLHFFSSSLSPHAGPT